LWDVESGQERAFLQGHTLYVSPVVFSPDGKTLASGSSYQRWYDPRESYRGEIKLWDVHSGQERASLKGHTGPIYSVVFSPDGKTLATGSRDKTIKLWDAQSGQERATLKGHTHDVWSVVFSPDGKTLASGSQDKTIKLWDVPPGP
jgi:WD40 repeat protein